MDLISAVRAIRPPRNLNIVPINPFSRSGPASSLSFRKTSSYVEAALQTRLTLPGLLGFSTGSCGKYHSFPKVHFIFYSFNMFMNPISTSVSIDCGYSCSGLGHFGIFAPLSKADRRLSRSFSVGLALVQSRTFPFRNAHLWTLSYSLASLVPAVLFLTDWRRWFRRHKFLCPTRFG